MAVTPNRAIWLDVDGPEYSTVIRAGFHMNWGAQELGKADGWIAKVNIDGTVFNVTGHENTQRVGGDCWILQHLNMMKFAAMTPGFTGARMLPGNFTVAPNIQWQNMFRPPTDLPGGGGTGMFTTTAPAMRRRVPAGQAWDHANAMLGADQAAYPGPVDPQYPDLLPVDRIAVSTSSFEANQGFGLTFAMQNDFWGTPTFLRFYFGGPATMQPLGAHGGEFCLTLRGNGQALLYERDQTVGPPPVTVWRRRKMFFWAEPNSVTGGSHSIVILPLARDRILFLCRISDQPPGPQGLVMPPMTGGHISNPTEHLYRDSPGLTGHLHQSSMTGAGPARLDWMRTYKGPAVPWLIQYPPTGYVIDQPFAIPQAIDANQPLVVYVDGFAIGTGTGVNVDLYNATTGIALTESPPGVFLTHQSQQTYFAKFNFTASANQFQTPVLFGYEVRSPSEIVTRLKTPVSGKVRDGSVTGPDIQPGQGSARVSIRDHRGVFPILRQHDRRYCRLRVTVPTTGPFADPRGFVVIHQGETWQPRAQLRGREGLGNKQWWDYQVDMIDMWLRVQKQFSMDWVNYRFNRAEPIPGTTDQFQQPVILAVIRDLLYRAGIPLDEIDAPGWDDPGEVRLWHSPNLTPDDYQLVPGQDISILIKRLAFDILGKVVIRDPNAYNATNPQRGMWRVLSPPQPDPEPDPYGQLHYPLSNSRAAFYVKRNTAAGAPPHIVEDEGGMGIDPTGDQVLSYIKDESYFVYPEAPERTALAVWGAAQLQDSGKGNQNIYSWTWNPKAVNWSEAHPTADPDSISYMDRLETALIYDRMFCNADAVRYAAARIARMALNGRKWCTFVAPLVFVKDPADALLGDRRRPLRVYDQVTLYDENGDYHPVMLRNVNPYWTSSRIMWAYHQALFLDVR